MTRWFLTTFVAASFLVAGCGSNGESAPSQASKPDKPAVSNGAEPATKAAEPNEIKVGMDLVEVKAVKGAPDDTKHEHGPAGQEYDIWIWKDVQATIENGKVIKVDKR